MLNWSLSGPRDYRVCTEYGTALRCLLNILLDIATQCSQIGTILAPVSPKRKSLKLVSTCSPARYPLKKRFKFVLQPSQQQTPLDLLKSGFTLGLQFKVHHCKKVEEAGGSKDLCLP